jgi:hypothetical protein
MAPRLPVPIEAADRRYHGARGPGEQGSEPPVY